MTDTRLYCQTWDARDSFGDRSCEPTTCDFFPSEEAAHTYRTSRIEPIRRLAPGDQATALQNGWTSPGESFWFNADQDTYRQVVDAGRLRSRWSPIPGVNNIQTAPKGSLIHP